MEWAWSGECGWNWRTRGGSGERKRRKRRKSTRPRAAWYGCILFRSSATFQLLFFLVKRPYSPAPQCAPVTRTPWLVGSISQKSNAGKSQLAMTRVGDKLGGQAEGGGMETTLKKKSQGDGVSSFASRKTARDEKKLTSVQVRHKRPLYTRAWPKC
jgi:hypothetical protein